jgi:transposase InsO family protein
VVLDLYARAVVGWAMDKRMTAQLVTDALVMALWRRGAVKGLILHRDSGLSVRRERLSAAVAIRMASIVPCHAPATANAFAVMESFFGTLKQELVHHERYATRQAAKASIFDYIEVFYNQQRTHSAIHYQAPMVFEKHSACA